MTENQDVTWELSDPRLLPSTTWLLMVWVAKFCNHHKCKAQCLRVWLCLKTGPLEDPYSKWCPFKVGKLTLYKMILTLCTQSKEHEGGSLQTQWHQRRLMPCSAKARCEKCEKCVAEAPFTPWLRDFIFESPIKHSHREETEIIAHCDIQTTKVAAVLLVKADHTAVTDSDLVNDDKKVFHVWGSNRITGR